MTSTPATIDFDAYALEVNRFADYPDVDTGSQLAIAYVTLGIVGEAGELREALRTDAPTVLSEAGDVSWYLSRLETELDIEPTQPHPWIEAEDQSLGDTICVQAAMLAEAVKKSLRDGSGLRCEPHMAAIKATLVAVAHEREATLGQVHQINTDKIKDRFARGVINGRGDHR